MTVRDWEAGTTDIAWLHHLNKRMRYGWTARVNFEELIALLAGNHLGQCLSPAV